MVPGLKVLDQKREESRLKSERNVTFGFLTYRNVFPAGKNCCRMHFVDLQKLLPDASSKVGWLSVLLRIGLMTTRSIYVSESLQIPTEEVTSNSD